MPKKACIAIIDYNLGNTLSVSNAIETLGYKIIISAQESELMAADALVLPGVGAFEVAMAEMRKKELLAILSELVLVKRKPLLGICLGMQLLAATSEENGHHQGLNFIPGNVKKIVPAINHSPVPHVGWNDISCDKNSLLYQKLDVIDHRNKNFYFDHSYYFDCPQAFQSSTVNYGGLDLTASVQKDNIYGVQFHPEKSQNNGLRLFRSFIEGV